MTEQLAVAQEPALRSDPSDFGSAYSALSTTAGHCDSAALACGDLGRTGWEGFTGEAAAALGVLVQSVGVSLSTIPTAGRQFADALDAASAALEALQTRSDALAADAADEQALLDTARVELDNARTRHRQAAMALIRLVDEAYDAQLAVVDQLAQDVATAEQTVEDHEEALVKLQEKFDKIRDEEDTIHFDLAAAEMRLDFPEPMAAPEVSALIGSATGVIELFDEVLGDTTLHPGYRSTLRDARDALEGFLGEPPAPDGSTDAELTAAALTALTDAQAAIDSGAIFDPTHVITGENTDDIIEVTQLGTGELEVTVNGLTYTLTPAEASRLEIDARGGDDTVVIDASVTVGVTIHGGTGNDTIEGGSGNDDIDGGFGADIIDSGGGDDIVVGGSGSDDIATGAGNDLVNGGAGNDTIATGEDPGWGIPTFPFPWDPSTPAGDADRVLGGTGNDTVDTGSGDDTVFGGSGNDTVTAGSGDDHIDGGAGGDDLRGDSGADTIDGGTGIDYIDGGNGDDHLDGQHGDDVIYGSDGDDTIEGSQGNDYLDGGEGGDAIDGGSGNDLLAGGTGDDMLTGGEGNDTVFTGSGFDHVDVAGDTGHDTVHGETHDTVDADGGDDVRPASDIDPDLGDSIVINGSSEFRARIEADLELFRQSPEGRELLASLDASGHTVTIVETAPGACSSDTGNCASADDYGVAYRAPDGTPGAGSGGTANIHLTGKLNSGGILGDTPPSIVTFHELLHNQDYVNGTLELGESLDPGNPVNADGNPSNNDFDNNRELDVVGLDYDPVRDLDNNGFDDVGDGQNTDPFTQAVVEPNHRETTENSFRDDLGYAPREQY